jgi:hypothetical protein
MGRGRSGPRIVRVLGVVALLAWPAAARSQFTPFSDHQKTLLEGNWQSCREADGQYSERVYDGRFPGIPRFELHMGPYHEFALFPGIQESHREHSSPENLLQPYSVGAQGGTTASHTWQAGGLVLEVVLAGGSRDDCESWFVTLKRLNRSASR